MISRGLLNTGCLACVYLLTQIVTLFGAQDSPKTNLVEVDGLGPTYTSCAYVAFSVKNISQRDVYVEVYAERSESGSWKYEDYPYDLKDPKSRYVKRVLTNPDMLKPGSSLPLTFDRCARPTFVKETDKQYRKAIIERDSKSGVPTLQRFRIQVYDLDEHGHVKFVQSVFSESFKRFADEDSAGSSQR
jgi:hypothetical protein